MLYVMISISVTVVCLVAFLIDRGLTDEKNRVLAHQKFCAIADRLKDLENSDRTRGGELANRRDITKLAANYEYLKKELEKLEEVRSA